MRISHVAAAYQTRKTAECKKQKRTEGWQIPIPSAFKIVVFLVGVAVCL
jgi:hypothetical protein